VEPRHLRVEAVSSQGLFKDFGPYHFFTNSQYLDGNTNKGFMVGNAIGRDSRAIEGRTSYWFSDRTRVEAGSSGIQTCTCIVRRGFNSSSLAAKRH
jgi:Capsule assembly protein Wzi